MVMQNDKGCEVSSKCYACKKTIPSLCFAGQNTFAKTEHISVWAETINASATSVAKFDTLRKTVAQLFMIRKIKLIQSCY